MNVYERLTDLIEYMSDKTFSATITNLAKATGIYEQQILQDIEYLQTYEAPKGNLLFQPYITTSQLDGKTCYHMDSGVFIGKHTSNVLFPMTVLERKFYRRTILDYNIVSTEHPVISDYFGEFSVYVVPHKGYNEYNKNLATVNKAIRKGYSLKLTTAYMTPHFIRRDLLTGLVYVMETYEKNNYIDIDAVPLEDLDIEELVVQTSPPPSAKAAERVNCMWGFDPDTLDEVADEAAPTHIKLKIFADNPLIIDKIKADTASRCDGALTGPLQDTTNMYYYEDDVLGMTSFKTWVKQFGSSVIVLEPKSLAYEIYKEASQ